MSSSNAASGIRPRKLLSQNPTEPIIVSMNDVSKLDKNHVVKIINKLKEIRTSENVGPFALEAIKSAKGNPKFILALYKNDGERLAFSRHEVRNKIKKAASGGSRTLYYNYTVAFTDKGVILGAAPQGTKWAGIFLQFKSSALCSQFLADDGSTAMSLSDEYIKRGIHSETVMRASPSSVMIFFQTDSPSATAGIGSINFAKRGLLKNSVVEYQHRFEFESRASMSFGGPKAGFQSPSKL